MKYRHSHKEEYADYFKKLKNGNQQRKKHSDGCLECGRTTARHHNKFCSKECYFKYKAEHRKEYQGSYDKISAKMKQRECRNCKCCGDRYYPNYESQKFCHLDCKYEYQKSHPEEYKRDVEMYKKSYQKFKNQTERYEKFLKINSKRMKSNNPMKDPVILEKCKKSCKEYWDTHPKEKEARIKRFMQAPLRGRGKAWKPTSMEQKIIDLNIPGLYYVGDGSVFVTIGSRPKRRKKNPDFLLRGKKRVIEVGDTVFWHTMEEVKQTVKDYECINYKCLYLTTKEMSDRQVYEKMAREFCGEGLGAL